MLTYNIMLGDAYRIVVNATTLDNPVICRVTSAANMREHSATLYVDNDSDDGTMLCLFVCAAIGQPSLQYLPDALHAHLYNIVLSMHDSSVSAPPSDITLPYC